MRERALGETRLGRAPPASVSFESPDTAPLPGPVLTVRPRQLWQLDISSVWLDEHGWCYLNAIIDCCIREIVGWSLELRCRAGDAIAVVEQAAAVRRIDPGELVVGLDTARTSPPAASGAGLAEFGIKHRPGGCRDPESQTFIDSWFEKLKRLNDTRPSTTPATGSVAYADGYRQRPRSRLDYKTAYEVKKACEDLQNIGA